MLIIFIRIILFIGKKMGIVEQHIKMAKKHNEIIVEKYRTEIKQYCHAKQNIYQYFRSEIYRK